MTTHWKGPLLGSSGLFKDMPANSLSIQNASVLYLDFLSQFDEDEITLTTITSGTGDLIADVANGVYRLEATTANEGLGSVQFANADNASEGVAVPLAGRQIAFEARVTCDDWSDCDWFIGLGE